MLAQLVTVSFRPQNLYIVEAKFALFICRGVEDVPQTTEIAWNFSTILIPHLLKQLLSDRVSLITLPQSSEFVWELLWGDIPKDRFNFRSGLNHTASVDLLLNLFNTILIFTIIDPWVSLARVVRWHNYIILVLFETIIFVLLSSWKFYVRPKKTVLIGLVEALFDITNFRWSHQIRINNLFLFWFVLKLLNDLLRGVIDILLTP